MCILVGTRTTYDIENRYKANNGWRTCVLNVRFFEPRLACGNESESVAVPCRLACP